MSHARLFDAGPRQKRRGRWLPVAVAPICPRRGCARPLVRIPSALQPALFIHGGYGASERVTFDMCAGCGWTRVVATETVSPLEVRL